MPVSCSRRRTLFAGSARLVARCVLAALSAALFAAVLSAAGPTLGARATPADPAPVGASSPAPETAAWLPYWSVSPGLATLTGRGVARGAFTTVSPFWHDVTSCTRITPQLSAATARAAVARLRASGAAVVPTLTASGLDPARAVACLSRPSARDAHIARIVDLVRRGGYDGIDLDYEHLAVTTDRTTARQVRVAFRGFVAALCPRLQALDRQCVVTVMARTGDDGQERQGSPSVWQGSLSLGAYDYAALGAAASRVRVMAYDEHTRRTPAGPIASYPWVAAVSRYALLRIPADRLTLGVPVYGRDWSGGTARTLTGDAATRLARQARVTPRWDATAREYTFTYRSRGVRHTVWFPGTRGILARDRLARSLGIGAVLWAAGLEPPGAFAALRPAVRR